MSKLLPLCTYLRMAVTCSHPISSNGSDIPAKQSEHLIASIVYAARGGIDIVDLDRT